MSSADGAIGRPWSRFAPRLVAARLRAGMTQVALARACGKNSNAWIVQLESGVNAAPRQFDDIVTIARVLDVPVEWLLFGKSFATGDSRLALGIGGPDVLLGRTAVAELAVYGAEGVRGDGCWLCNFEKPSPADSTSWYALDQRGTLLILRGRLTAEMALVDAGGAPISRARVVATCRAQPSARR